MDTDRTVTGAVVAGGASRRMGRDKRYLEVDGVPLLRRVVDVVAPLVDDLHVIVASEHDRASLTDLLGDATIDRDQRPGQGPLAGIEAALIAARHDLVLIVAADHPRLAPAVLRSLVDHLDAHPARQAAAVVTDRGPQPLLAAYRRSALTSVTELLDRGERRATAMLETLDPVRLEPEVWWALDPTRDTARDLDTPEDLDAFGLDRRDRAARRSVVSVRGGTATRRRDLLVDEEPLEVRACGPGQDPVTVVTTMRTRGHDEDLAIGWLWSEGLLAAGGVSAIRTGDPFRLARPDDQLTVHLSHPLDLDAVTHRHVLATASCGVCGRASIDELTARAVPLDPAVPVAPDPTNHTHAAAGSGVPWALLAGLPDRLRDAQELFASTGAIHATGIFTRTGELLTVREDIGRHNALDAAIGAHVRAGEVPMHDRIGVLSGRIGFELVAKAAVAGLPILAAVGAPSDLAVRTAERFGITLVGFLRRGDGNVYTHAERLEL